MSLLHMIATITLQNPLPKTNANLFENIMYIVMGTLGGISLIIMVWAGMKYTLSSGDPQKTSEARNQILYAAIGIVVAISASAIVGFVAGTKL
ncbi:hypothetical protein KC930_01110 [Candidatus Saccharibacteria bacterium]|nr:hypothetical protein [Candidatus Saccharibacteria bacterium]